VIEIGMQVRFKRNEDAALWRATGQVGKVIDVRAFGPSEAMVTVRFDKVSAHVADHLLEAAIDR
jgi:hypothetical protein